MKLFWAHDEKYPEDIGFYAVENADDLIKQLAQERKLTIEHVREKFLYAELSQVYNEKLSKYFKITVEEIK
ncbi:hypothetical protein ACFQZE_07130 [Paenibacillus sp. GCM10027627]|uniref:hypothetical protein n=1 Tax=unclassified Paenibacillus TaxID=185978 RepID=UPI00362D22CF